MSSEYQSLYRKYRPAAFSEIIGQRHVTQTLANAIKAARISHAYLFCGPRGTGKTTTARVLAMALNCVKGTTAEPCGDCEACLEIKRGASLDVIEFDAASHRGVDDIEELRRRFQFAPGQTRYKIYIIDEVHQLSDAAFDMLLKVLEEPPAQVVFVLATTEVHKIKPTILSRCQRFDFHRISPKELQERLQAVCKQEKLQAEDAALSLLA
ncbi:MAG: DNA polymerase III subunit gamma/tau, partial [Armatimonadetes bacterium]|nr:DNA polymerase III subunit gamma/tau [Armatimonadota bacterium]NIM23139.1 DNA polymerase III subunit gamma/tau [Armatimonadota bacterium]NIM67007.1 DNA polymerase III subunit gamma/tau [Armatimonadota bacterium]NIM75541.1 DNA polymerase III subunit gamma/tau [Armatimonadota bacterium]NIN05196.1 DNA polymerase III subunit gamma/tau [Armatimonadota bacterium]